MDDTPAPPKRLIAEADDDFDAADDATGEFFDADAKANSCGCGCGCGCCFFRSPPFGEPRSKRLASLYPVASE